MLKKITLALLTVVLSLSALVGCDMKKIEALEEGVATEAEVRAQWGEPAATYPEENGAKTLEYPRQPEGQRNYMITVGTDGKMSALRQVLKNDSFAKITPGLNKAQVRRMLGRPGKTQIFALKKDEEIWDWRYLDGAQGKVFSVTFDKDGLVVATGSILDPRENFMGGK